MNNYQEQKESTEEEWKAFLTVIAKRFNAKVIPDKPKFPWEE